MKRTILTFAITGVILGASLTAFGQEDKKAEEARKEVAEAKKDVTEAMKDLREAKVDSAADFQKFKTEAEVKIKENQKKITALKARKSKDSKEVREKYDKKVLALQVKNDELKKKIHESPSTKTTMWSSFKREFNHDMDELGHAIKDIGIDNTK